MSGLDKKLVPFDAANVLVCRYPMGALAASRLLVSVTAARFEDGTNRLPILSPAEQYRACHGRPVDTLFVITFASDTKQVTVGDSAFCGYLTNGVLVANPTAPWRAELLAVTAAISAKFVGNWSVHGAKLRINADGSGIQTGYFAGCGTAPITAKRCTETHKLDLLPSREGNSLTATVRSVVFTDATGGRIAKPFPPSLRPGDSFRLDLAAPLLLKTTFIRSHLSVQDLRGGNPYWCGPHPAAQYRHLCGA